MCRASTIPDEIFLDAAEAVALALSDGDMAEDRTVPHPDRLRDVGLAVATATVLSFQRLGLAINPLGGSAAEVRAALQALMWAPASHASANAKGKEHVMANKCRL
jgi:malic enzyme